MQCVFRQTIKMAKVVIEKNVEAGQTGKTIIEKTEGIVNIVESTEMGEILKNLNDDSSDDSKMSNIDLRSRLHFSEISGILAIDTLVSFSFIPERCLTFTRQKKRLAVSLGGQGRKEIVDIASAKREEQLKKTGVMDKIWPKSPEK